MLSGDVRAGDGSDLNGKTGVSMPVSVNDSPPLNDY